MLLRLLNISLLLVWAFFLVWLLTYGKGDLIRLIHPRLWWVLALAAGVLFLFFISFIVPHKQSGGETKTLVELPALLILLIPLLFFLNARDARLDGSAVQNRFNADESGFYSNNLPLFDLFDDTESSDMTFSKILREPQKYENQDVAVVCQSFVHEQLPENTAMCFRFMITCCAADAVPVFIFLSHQDSLKMENDRWIKVSGPLSVISNEGMEFASVGVEALEYVEEPAFPWAL
ncbi:MAG: TIGR03943 family protein [Desulfobulbaceae bacterium]|nr:MAG: TIGR03943 family protein [Desulfobulbaceae bacterium]